MAQRTAGGELWVAGSVGDRGSGVAMVDEVFAALGDPTRRHLYSQLAQHGPLTATVLASDMAISRQAVAKHLGVLSDAGMATHARVGRETRYEAALEPLTEIQSWIASVEGEWSDRLAALASSLAPES